MTRDAPSKSSVRALKFVFAFVALLALCVLTLSWHASLLDRYEFRQLQTALSTFWIARDGWQLAYATPLFGPPWSVPMEFPIYQLIVATLHNLSGYPLEQTGRAVSVLMLLACLPALHDLLGLARLPHSRRLIVHMLILTAPVYLFYARTFMIETSALCFSVWFLALLRRALEKPQTGWIVAVTLVGTLAALTKITTFLIFGIPAAALVIAALRHPGAAVRRKLLVALIAAGVSLGLAWWWIHYSDAIKDSNPFTGFLTSRELRTWNFGAWSLRLDWSFWLHMQETIVGYNLTEGAIAVALLCMPFAPARNRRIAGVALLGFISGPLVFANLYHLHDYYYAANSILLLTAAGLMIASCWDDQRLPRGANWLALGLILVFQFYAFYRGYYSHHRHPAPPPPALASAIRNAVPAEGVVLIYGADWNPLLPYYAQRRALMVPGERENETNVLEQVLARLPPRHIAAMVIHGSKLRGRPDFIRERAKRFGLSPQPAANDKEDDLYLPIGTLATSAQQSVTVMPPDALSSEKAFATGLKVDALPEAARGFMHPPPIRVRSKYGVSSAELEGRPILNAHAPSELVFHPPPGAHHLSAVAGLADGSFAPGHDAITDGITIDFLEISSDGNRRLLLHRQLAPAKNPGDRGPQTIELDLPRPFTGQLVLRLGNGPAGDSTNDWAYWGAIEIR